MPRSRGCASLDLLREPSGERVGSHQDARCVRDCGGGRRHGRSASESARVGSAEPLQASQVPIRDVAIDAVNSITRSAKGAGIALAAVRALAPAIRSGNNSVAVHQRGRARSGRQPGRQRSGGSARASHCGARLDWRRGGMEVRMMAVTAMEKVGLAAADVSTKRRPWGCCKPTRHAEAGSPRSEHGHKTPRPASRRACGHESGRGARTAWGP